MCHVCFKVFLPNFWAKWSFWNLVHVYSTVQTSWHTAVDSQASLVLKHQSNMANTTNELIFMTMWMCEQEEVGRQLTFMCWGGHNSFYKRLRTGPKSSRKGNYENYYNEETDHGNNLTICNNLIKSPPGGLVVRILGFHCQDSGSIPGQGPKILKSHMAECRGQRWGS